ncbi:methyltransferase domain-containing protein [Paenimyroides tangerinum]|uniref:Methyltransferase domain-containing protein n=1 Tax=Paenimyroides tangerinum TaxID=2488728 RepID=A0A3P3WFI0_9FLAO|nr:fused MFS/spermidine synthase [Paenimyroides tangerinum]RRJ91303.1 methyltransferase domain-containing protein [Paenimyroides tangerinum]
MIKKFLSYLIPIPIEIIPSNVSEQLELTWNNGKLVLDTKHTNYSYGNLQKVLRKGLLKIGKENINQMQHILLLGVAGGSVVETLTREFKFEKKITGIEIDPVVIKVAEKYFHLNEIQNFEVILADANIFVTETKHIYDLIIIDIFEDCFMPDFVYSEAFISNIKKILKPKGYILFNTIVLNKTAEEKNKSYKNQFESTKFVVQSFPNIDDKNELFLIKKEYE